MATNAYGVIDKEEEVEFIQVLKGATGNAGELYVSMISLCNNEVSKLISGAVVGEESITGSKAREEVADEMIKRLIDKDKKDFETYFNSIVLPRLISLGYPIGEFIFKFTENRDIDGLWRRTQQAMQYYNMDVEWLNQTFQLKIDSVKTDNKAEKPDNLSEK